MSQLSIFDEPPPRRPAVSHTLFFAVTLDTAQASVLAATGARLAREFAPGSKPVEAPRLHVSLHALASEVEALPPSLVELGLRAGARVASSAFDLVFDRVARFGARALVLTSAAPDPSGGLRTLHEALGIALADGGLRITAGRFTPHMTIAYGARERVDAAIEPVRWRAREIALIHSHVGLHRHDVVGRWFLAD